MFVAVSLGLRRLSLSQKKRGKFRIISWITFVKK